MGVTLQATARLDTRPFSTSLNNLAARLESLGIKTNALNAKSALSAERAASGINKAALSSAAAQQAVTKAAIDSNRANAQTAMAARNQVEAQAAAQRKLNAANMAGVQSLQSQRHLYNDMSRMASRTALGFAALPAAAIAAGVVYEKQFADVIRTADPKISASAATVENLRLSLRDMVQTMPTSWGDVTEIAPLANQMGIGATQTANFTRAVSMFSATSGVSVDMVATAFGRLQSIVPSVNGDFNGLADSILKVGVNSVATEGEIINVVTQISSIAGAAAFSDKEMIGLAGALASVRVPPELARGVITRVFGQISRAVSDGGASLEGFSRIAGMSSAKFADSWGREGQSGKAFQSFIKGIKELGPKAEAELRGLGITSVRDVPVVLRLAMAADSEGVIGGLLKQTMDDAENAAGETQRQYTIMADTVAAKLKVVGNNVLAFFAEAGKGSLGPLGDMLDSLSESIADVTNSLDDNVKVLGSIELPFTNGELLGTVASMALLTTGVLALGAAGLKIAEGAVSMKAFMGILGGVGKGGAGGEAQVNKLGQSYLALPGQIRTGMTWAVQTAESGNRKLYAAQAAASSRLSNLRKAPSAVGSFGGKVNTANFDDAARKAEASSARISGAFSKASAGVTAAASRMGAAASFAFGPWGLAIGLATMLLGTFIESTRGATTEASDLAEVMAKFGTGAQSLRALNNIEVGGLFGNISKPFEDGYKSVKKLNDESLKLLETERFDTSNAATARWAATGNAVKTTTQMTKNSKEYSAAVKVMDDSFGELVSAGNGALAATLLTKFTGSASELNTVLNADSAKNMKRYFDSAFDSENLKVTKDNLQDLADGKLPKVQAALLGMATATAVTAEELENLEGGGTAFAKMIEGANNAAAAFINYSEAIAKATAEGGSLGDFTAELNTQIAAQQKWGENLAKVAQIGGSEAVDAFVAMGPEVAPVLQQIVDNFQETGGSVDGAWKAAMDAVQKSTKTAAGNLAVEIGVARDEMVNVLKSSELADALIGSIDDPAMYSVLSKSMQKVGTDFSTEIANGIVSGKYTVEEALGRLALENDLKINTNLNVDPAKLSLDALVALGNGTITTMQLDALPDLAKNAIWDTVTLADGTVGILQVDANTLAATTGIVFAADSAGKMKPIINVGANTSAVDRAAGNYNGRVLATSFIDVVQRITGVNQAPAGIRKPYADGGIAIAYANGGMREDHRAQIVPAGTNRLLAEPETGGEAYIPLHSAKRTRSLGILDTVAQRFGYNLTKGAEYTQYASGGEYNSQRYNRQMQVRTSQTDGSGVRQAPNFTFINPVVRDSFEDAWEKQQTVGWDL